MNKLKTVLVLTTLVISILCDAQNNEWMQFRGPNASGIAPENAKPPVEFSQDKNILWKTSIPSGVSSPCICGSNIFITGVDIENKKYLVWNINRMDGSLKWQREIAVDTFQYVHSVSSPAAATPTIMLHSWVNGVSYLFSALFKYCIEYIP